MAGLATQQARTAEPIVKPRGFVPAENGPAENGPAENGPVTFAPTKTVEISDVCLRNWLLPPIEPTGLEAVVQFTSKAAGVLSLAAGAAGLLWACGLL